jgi:Gram-negative bacterial TonB protein C-terminal
MTNALKNTLLLMPAIVACLICSIVLGQEKQNSCRDHQPLWRDARGEPVRLSSKELMKRRIHCEATKLPGGNWCPKGQVMFLVVINAEGKVECAEAVNGHPLVKPYALDALKKWTFKPVEVDGKSIAAPGIAVVDVSWDSGPSQCRSKRPKHAN